MKIFFDCLGFGSASVFVEKEGRGHFIGDLFLRGQSEMNYYGTYERHLSPEEVPDAVTIRAEYDKQLAEKGVCLNQDIIYAG